MQNSNQTSKQHIYISTQRINEKSWISRCVGALESRHLMQMKSDFRSTLILFWVFRPFSYSPKIKFSDFHLKGVAKRGKCTNTHIFFFRPTWYPYLPNAVCFPRWAVYLVISNYYKAFTNQRGDLCATRVIFITVAYPILRDELEVLELILWDFELKVHAFDVQLRNCNVFQDI